MADSPTYSQSSATKEAALFYNNSKRLWRFLLITLPFDFLLLLPWFSFLHYGPWTYYAKSITLILLTISFILVFRNKLLPLVLGARRLSDQDQSAGAKLLAKVISFLLFGGVLVLINVIESLNFGALLIPLMLTAAAIYSLFKSLKDARLKSTEDQHLLITTQSQEFGSRYVFYLDLVAVTTARLLSPSGALIACQYPDSFLTFLPYFLVALVLLLEMAPHKELYIEVCKGCALPTSTVFMVSGFCPACIKKRYLETGRKYSKKSKVKRFAERLNQLTETIVAKTKTPIIPTKGKNSFFPARPTSKSLLRAKNQRY